MVWGWSGSQSLVWSWGWSGFFFFLFFGRGVFLSVSLVGCLGSGSSSFCGVLGVFSLGFSGSGSVCFASLGES